MLWATEKLLELCTRTLASTYTSTTNIYTTWQLDLMKYKPQTPASHLPLLCPSNSKHVRAISCNKRSRAFPRSNIVLLFRFPGSDLKQRRPHRCWFTFLLAPLLTCQRSRRRQIERPSLVLPTIMPAQGSVSKNCCFSFPSKGYSLWQHNASLWVHLRSTKQTDFKTR